MNYCSKVSLYAESKSNSLRLQDSLSGYEIPIIARSTTFARPYGIYYHVYFIGFLIPSTFIRFQTTMIKHKKKISPSFIFSYSKLLSDFFFINYSNNLLLIPFYFYQARHFIYIGYIFHSRDSFSNRFHRLQHG